MNEQITNSIPTNDLPRCQHRTPTGRRCRHAVSGVAAGFCSKHSISHPIRLEEGDLSAILTAGLTEFKSAAPINEFLSRLLHLEAEDRIHPRRAAVMAYTCNLLLRTLPAIVRENHPQSGDEPQIIIDIPGPRRDDPVPPSHPIMDWLTPGTNVPNSKESSCPR